MYVLHFRFPKMMSIILILFLKLCLAQDFQSDYTQTTKQLVDKFDWKNNFDNNVIIPDAYVFHCTTFE